MKKILILSASTGAGHVRAGEALLKTAKTYVPEAAVSHIDIADLFSAPARLALVNSYNKFLGRLPRLWGAFYEKTQTLGYRRRAKSFMKLIHAIDASPLQALVRAEAPEYILATHFFPSLLLNQTVPIGTIVTDYAVHPLWHEGASEKYFVSTEDMKATLTERGIPENAIFITGIPVHPDFYTLTPKKMAGEGEPKRILLLSGGYGLGKTKAIARTIFTVPQTMHVTSIAGKNSKLEYALRQLTPPPHIQHEVVGWTPDIHVYMNNADIIIGKPGGLTVTESVALGKPFIATHPIPGHEDANVEYLESRGYGALAKNPIQLLSLIRRSSDFIAPGYKNSQSPPTDTRATDLIWRIIAQNGLT